MFSFLRKQPSPVFDAAPAPDVPLAVIGDIHGSDGLLERLLDRLDAQGDPATRVCVGDYVDRGENSAGVIDLLMTRQQADPDRLICLMGNHERMMLDFLDAPARCGPRWMKHGGMQTVASFRITPPSAGAGDDDWRDLRDRLESALGARREAWLRARPLLWQSGNVAVVHAGADPALPLADQSEQALLWGHPDFDRTPRRDGIWVVHGHTIVPEPTADQGRVATDTGAYATGRLTAAMIDSSGVRFIRA
ncbi:metallophosphoesterase [Rhodophyticola sp.]|jgi:serine/threonine protein phosphatase 1|uniref:metallophosphoesterase n=1 Tax=Rhodophyticola sp. TaxID=2680032 RepID=UPI003D297C20